jgi:hypothetical protein
MTSRKPISQAELKELLSYDPETGVFRRKVTIDVNTRAGDVAGRDNGHGYLRMRVRGQSYHAHRLAFLYVVGELPSEHVDHINGIKDDNRWCNLRQVNRLENTKNAKLNANNKSGVMGVGWNSARGKWHAFANEDGKQKHLGLFSDISDAVKARLEAEKAFGYHPNHGRLE